jgi:WD40 repeat protein
VRLIDATTTNVRLELTLRSWILDVELDARGERIAVATQDRGAFVLSADDGRELLHLDGPNGPVGSITFSPDQRHLLSAHDEGSAIEWDARTGSRERTFRHSGFLWSVIYAPDGALIVSTSADGLASVWDTATARLLATLPHGAPVYEPAFTPDGRWLVTPSGDARVRLWDLGRDTRDVAALDELVRCRVPLRLEGGVLAPAVPGGAGCP